MIKIQNKIGFAIAIVLVVAAILLLGTSPKGASASNGLAGSNLQGGAQNSTDMAGNILYPKAPELAGISGYINAPQNLTLASLKGKVVLVDFWTYSCINCIRTLPYLESWYQKYGKDGFVIVGVHTPEFDFEKNYSNVQAAVAKFGITYPVVQDNDYATWNAYGNQYWPRHYLLDAQGRVHEDHIGEGGYDQTETEIVALLSEAKSQKVEMNATAPNVSGTQFDKIQSPELYFGHDTRRQALGNANPTAVGDIFNASVQGAMNPNVAYLEGTWQDNSDSALLVSGTGAVDIDFSAGQVNIVAGSRTGSPIEAKAYVDGSLVQTFNITGQRLYTAAEVPQYGQHTIRIVFESPDVELYTFTFG